MAALAADRVNKYGGGLFKKQSYPVKASAVIYGGAGICLEAADGFARPVAASLTNPEFLGFALEKKTGTGTSGAVVVQAQTEGILITALANVAGATAVTDIGATVYMSDDQTFTLTSTNNVAIGKVVNLVDGDLHIHFQAAAMASL